MQKLTIKAGLLLAIALLPLLFFVSTLIHQQWTRWEMIERLEHSKLTELEIPTQDVHWIKSGKEILVNGKLFDVKSSSFQNGYTYFKGLYDEEETAIVQQINNQMHNEQETQRLHQTLLCYLLLGGNPSPTTTHSVITRIISLSYRSFHEGLIPPPSLERMTPPPQC